MAQSCNCARLVLPHTLFLESSASLRFFGVVDCVSCLDSESAGLDSVNAFESIGLVSIKSLRF